MNYKFGNNPYELPTNTDLEKVLKKNLDHINPVEMKEKTVDGKKMLFPFWTPVGDSAGNTFTDPKEYLASKSKQLDIKVKKDNVGVVQPKDATKNATKTYEDSSFADKILSIINNHNDSAVYDNSGAVKAISFAMGNTSTSKQVTDNDTTNPKDAVVDKSAKSKTGVGAVDPKAAGLEKTKTSNQVTDNDTTDPKDATVDKAAKSKTGVGAVDPKAFGLEKTKTSKQVTSADTTTPKAATVEKSAKSKTGVGAVSPKDGMGKQNTVDVDAGATKAKDGMEKQNSVSVTSAPKVKKATKLAHVKVDKSAKSKTGVGAVAPKADMGSQNNVGPINFDKFKTDHITKA
jgi:hypothetical protein